MISLSIQNERGVLVSNPIDISPKEGIIVNLNRYTYWSDTKLTYNENFNIQHNASSFKGTNFIYIADSVNLYRLDNEDLPHGPRIMTPEVLRTGKIFKRSECGTLLWSSVDPKQKIDKDNIYNLNTLLDRGLDNHNSYRHIFESFLLDKPLADLITRLYGESTASVEFVFNDAENYKDAPSNPKLAHWVDTNTKQIRTGSVHEAFASPSFKTGTTSNSWGGVIIFYNLAEGENTLEALRKLINLEALEIGVLDVEPIVGKLAETQNYTANLNKLIKELDATGHNLLTYKGEIATPQIHGNTYGTDTVTPLLRHINRVSPELISEEVVKDVENDVLYWIGG